MNHKLQKTLREIERVKGKIAELQASLPLLEKQKTELENAEIIKIYRTADVAPADFAAFIQACKANMAGGAELPGLLPQPNKMTEDMNDDEE